MSKQSYVDGNQPCCIFSWCHLLHFVQSSMTSGQRENLRAQPPHGVWWKFFLSTSLLLKQSRRDRSCHGSVWWRPNNTLLLKWNKVCLLLAAYIYTFDQSNTVVSINLDELESTVSSRPPPPSREQLEKGTEEENVPAQSGSQLLTPGMYSYVKVTHHDINPCIDVSQNRRILLLPQSRHQLWNVSSLQLTIIQL